MRTRTLTLTDTNRHFYEHQKFCAVHAKKVGRKGHFHIERRNSMLRQKEGSRVRDRECVRGSTNERRRLCRPRLPGDWN